MELKKCFEKYLSEFNNDSWLPSNFENEEAIRNLFNKISDFIDFSFIQLTRSIISGEYIEYVEIENILKNFLEMITGFDNINHLDEVGSYSDLDRIKMKFNELNNSLYNALRYYQNFIEGSKRKFDLNLSNEKYGAFQIRSNIRENTLSFFTDLTIPLCKYDYNLPVQSKDFKNIILVRNRLIFQIGCTTFPELRDMFTLLLYKCNYIIQRVKTSPFESKSNFITEIIYPQNLELGDYGAFTKMPNDDEKECLDNIKSDQQCVLPFVYLMKYYKDNLVDSKDIKLMDYVIERYLEKYNNFLQAPFTDDKPFKRKYDTFSWNSVLNYLHNCRFSFYVQKGNPNLKGIKREINRIQDIQGSTYINNFHPYEKAIEAIISCVKGHLKSNKFNDWLIEDKLDELNRLLNKYEAALQWSENHKFFPFQLPFDESCCNSESYKLKLFVPSAFATDIDYKSLNNTLMSFKKERDNLAFLFSLSKERRDIEVIKETIKTTDKKAFDLIAIFTAAITFLFGTINIFVANEKIDLAQLICNTTGLGVILILFTSLYLLVSPIFIQRINLIDYLKSWRLWFGLLGLIFYVSLIVYLYQNTKSLEKNIVKDKELKRMEMVIDSLKQEQKSISLIINDNNKNTNAKTNPIQSHK